MKNHPRNYEEIVFQLFKGMIIHQNKKFLKEVSNISGLDYNDLLEKYLRPEYYLPYITKTVPKQ